jgi:hypothetical protein
LTTRLGLLLGFNLWLLHASAAPPSCVDHWLHVAMQIETQERERWGEAATVARHGYRITVTPHQGERPFVIDLTPPGSQRPVIRTDCQG